MTGYNTIRGHSMRYQSDMSVRDCIHMMRRLGYDNLREGTAQQDLAGTDLLSARFPNRRIQHKAQFAANWFNLNIQVREWGRLGNCTHYMWHHKPTETVLMLTKEVVMQHKPNRIQTNSNQPFYSIDCNVFRDGFGGWIAGVTVIKEGGVEIPSRTPFTGGGQ